MATAVKDGKITQAQADLITAKQNELQAKHEAAHDALKDKTQAERKAAMEKEREETKQWLADNKIPEGYLMGGLRMRGHGGPPPADAPQE